MKFFNVISINKQSNIITYYLDGSILPVVSSTSDLGITVELDLSFKLHISNIISKASQRVGVLLSRVCFQTFGYCTKNVYNIRPILEYNSNVWNPTHKYLVDKFENVQRRFTKRMSSISNFTYLERLGALNLQPLELRRYISDVYIDL